MDATTENGLRAIADGNVGLARIGRPYVVTHQSRPADIDGFFLEGSIVIACFEVKTRYMSEEVLRGQFGNKWLISMDKVEKGAAVAKAVCAPFIGVLVLPPSAMTLSVQIANWRGEIVAKMKTEVTETQATCNGGKASRLNAFIDMTEADIWR